MIYTDGEFSTPLNGKMRSRLWIPYILIPSKTLSTYLITPIPVRPFAIAHDFPAHDTEWPHIRSWCKLSKCNGFGCRPSYGDLTSLRIKLRNWFAFINHHHVNPLQGIVFLSTLPTPSDAILSEQNYNLSFTLSYYETILLRNYFLIMGDETNLEHIFDEFFY